MKEGGWECPWGFAISRSGGPPPPPPPGGLGGKGGPPLGKSGGDGDPPLSDPSYPPEDPMGFGSRNSIAVRSGDIRAFASRPLMTCTTVCTRSSEIISSQIQPPHGKCVHLPVAKSTGWCKFVKRFQRLAQELPREVGDMN